MDIYSVTRSKGHLPIKSTFTGLQYAGVYFSMLLHLHIYKDHLCIRTMFCWSPEWSLYTSFTVYILLTWEVEIQLCYVITTTHVLVYTVSPYYIHIITSTTTGT